MNDASFCAALLQHPAITALVGNRVGLAQLKQGWNPPAVVYQVISGNDRPYLEAWQGPGQRLVRMQVNPLAASVDAVDAIHAAVRTSVQAKRGQLVDGYRLIHIEDGGGDQYDKDPTSSTWTRAADYLLTVEADML